MDYRVVRYSKKYEDRLKKYISITHPSFSKEYINYVVDNSISSINDSHSFIVVDSNDTIVGTHMFYNTKVKIHDVIQDTVWGHATFLDENVRHTFGLDFVLLINSERGFGIGLSDINRKIQKRLKTVFWDNLFNYCFPTRSLPVSLLFYPQRIKPMTSLFLKNNKFVLCKDLDDVRIRNNGFWFSGITDIDFIRDRDFLSKRFFQNRVHNYFVYQLEGEDCYFVVRYVRFKYIPTLFIVDYRFDNNKSDQLSYIVEAATMLANHSHLGFVLIMSNDENMASFLSKKCFLLKKATDYIGSRQYGIDEKSTSFVTAADSDADFIRG